MRVDAARRVALGVHHDGRGAGGRGRRVGAAAVVRAGEVGLVGVDDQRAVPPHARLAGDDVTSVQRAPVVGDVGGGRQHGLAVDGDLVDHQIAAVGVVVVLHLHLVRLVGRDVGGEGVVLGGRGGHALADLHAVDEQIEVRADAAGDVGLGVHHDGRGAGCRGGRRGSHRGRIVGGGGAEDQRAVPPHAFLAGDDVLAVQLEAVVAGLGRQHRVAVDDDRLDVEVAVLAPGAAVVVVDNLHLVGLAGLDVGVERVGGRSGRTHRGLADILAVHEQPEMRSDAAGGLPIGIDDELGVDRGHGSVPLFPVDW